MLKKESSATPERALDGHEVYDTLMKREQTPVEATPTESTTFKEPVNIEPTVCVGVCVGVGVGAWTFLHLHTAWFLVWLDHMTVLIPCPV